MENWRMHAACRDEDGSFLPHRKHRPRGRPGRGGQGGLPTLPVQEECLRWALENNQDSGVWGGLGENERRALKRRSRRQAHGSG